MARYFLNLRYGPDGRQRCDDPEGDEVADGTLLRDHALRVARAVARTPCHAVPNWWGCTFEIIDESGDLVLTVPFADSIAIGSGLER